MRTAASTLLIELFDSPRRRRLWMRPVRRSTYSSVSGSPAAAASAIRSRSRSFLSTKSSASATSILSSRYFPKWSIAVRSRHSRSLSRFSPTR
jgi:hypothetical protein